ncbi:hypothetical protein BJP34_13235 [Moorena producens PAL-8-15-08-1]|uniref:Uncharacterized protein n=1 Tax=Moorena producens PAL-8-15-08-1 TaxID=1458985 RepID=A0A1D8TRK0_9CYAN|nr:hypothetical protein BJP34_13235 [Moorena producens PAL-8-15-08-1]
MAKININDLSDLNMTGTELFNDSESFMTELNEEGEEMGAIHGGDLWCALPTCTRTIAVCQGCSCDIVIAFA